MQLPLTPSVDSQAVSLLQRLSMLQELRKEKLATFAALTARLENYETGAEQRVKDWLEQARDWTNNARSMMQP